MRCLFTLFVMDFSKAKFDLTVMLTIYSISRYPGYDKFMLANRFLITFLMICWNCRPMYVSYVISRKLCKKKLQVTENMTRIALKWIQWPLITPASSFFPEWLMTWKATFSSWQWDKVGCFDQNSNVSETVRKTIYNTNKSFFYFQKCFFFHFQTWKTSLDIFFLEEGGGVPESTCLTFRIPKLCLPARTY